MFSIKDLRELIANLPDDMPVGRVGWFGEFYEMDQGRFSVWDVELDHMRRSMNTNVFRIEPPDIGPEPE